MVGVFGWVFRWFCWVFDGYLTGFCWVVVGYLTGFCWEFVGYLMGFVGFLMGFWVSDYSQEVFSKGFWVVGLLCSSWWVWIGGL